MSAKYAKERKQFDVPIASFEAIQFMLAEMATFVYAMESMVYRTAAAYDEGKSISRQAAIVKTLLLRVARQGCGFRGPGTRRDGLFARIAG